MDLNSILASVSEGKMDPDRAKRLIDRLYSKSPLRPVPQDEPVSSPGATDEESEDTFEPRERLKSAFERLKKTVNIDELLKISSGLVHQIAESMPNQFEKIQENFSHNINTLGFSPNTPGIDAKLSVFRTFHLSADSRVEENQVVGSQWFGVNLSQTAEVKQNKFTAVQFSEVAVVRSNFNRNLVGLSRWSNVSIQEARVESNRMSRSTFSDVSLTESDFMNNRLTKSEFAQTVINASRLAGNEFSGADFLECEFDGCDIQGLHFENCTFRECAFHNLELNFKEPVTLANREFSGKMVRGARSLEELLMALEADDTAHGNDEEDVHVHGDDCAHVADVHSDEAGISSRPGNSSGPTQGQSQHRRGEPRESREPREPRETREPREPREPRERQQQRPQEPRPQEPRRPAAQASAQSEGMSRRSEAPQQSSSQSRQPKQADAKPSIDASVTPRRPERPIGGSTVPAAPATKADSANSENLRPDRQSRAPASQPQNVPVTPPEDAGDALEAQMHVPHQDRQRRSQGNRRPDQRNRPS